MHAILWILTAASLAEPGVLSIRADNIEVRASATLGPGVEVVTDADGNGVVHVLADGVVIDFANGFVLHGAPAGIPGDRLTGVGIRIDGRKNVTIRNARLSGFKVGIHANNADGLTLENIDVRNIYRMRLGSTPAAEDGNDWLWPHRNDQSQWRETYGGAIVIENSKGVTVRNCHVRESQNGIILDRVTNARVYDNDCSFLSGWGLAMWRSCDNIVSRNAFDFCVRGYSHTVYNRGQDSAGILMFEQCSRNIIAENSATHGGDGVFGFAGHDALGETLVRSERERLRKSTGKQDVDALIVVPEPLIAAAKRAGCNDNLFVGNDFSFAAAHGLEMTFSFGNRVIGNRFVSNAICGVWGGYSADTLIAGNYFESNGGAGYGEERGGINIEHGRDNRIFGNTFVKNAVGIHLWSRSGTPFSRFPWGIANAEDDGRGGRAIPSARAVIAGNTFEGDRAALRMRSTTGTVYWSNTASNVATEIDAEPGAVVDTSTRVVSDVAAPVFEDLGSKRPVGARPSLESRAAIVMTEWGPWDHTTVFFRERQRGPRADMFEVFGPAGEVVAKLEGSPDPASSPRIAVIQRKPDAPSRVPAQIVIAPPTNTPGIWPYTVRISGTGVDRAISGMLISAPWSVRLWNWTADPMKDLEAWRAEATSAKAVAAEFDALNLPFGYRSPSAMNLAPVVSEAALKPARFGIIARTVLPLRPGTWTIRITSDDGVRVIVDGKTLIERWNIHGPTTDEAKLTLDSARDVPITIEYFQNDGFATLVFDIHPSEPPVPSASVPAPPTSAHTPEP